MYTQHNNKKARIDKWDYIKSKHLCISKEIITRVKRQQTEWKKIFASYSSDREPITRIHEELKKIKYQKE
jgi:hypothetical protein